MCNDDKAQESGDLAADIQASQELVRLKLLFEFSKTALQQQDERWKNADEKAAKFIPILGILLGGAGFFDKWLIDSELLPPQNIWYWFPLICVVGVFSVILYSLFYVLRVLRTQKACIITVEDEDIKYFHDKDLRTIYLGYSYRLSDAARENQETVDKRIRWLIKVYYGIYITASLLVILLMMMGIHAWLKSGYSAGWDIPLDYLIGNIF